MVITGKILKTSIYHYKDYREGITRNLRPFAENFENIQLFSKDVITIFEYNKVGHKYENKKVFRFPTEMKDNNNIKKCRGILETQKCFVFVEIETQIKKPGKLPSICLRKVTKRSRKILITRKTVLAQGEEEKVVGCDQKQFDLQCEILNELVMENLVHQGEQYFEFFSFLKINNFKSDVKLKMALLEHLEEILNRKILKSMKHYLVYKCQYFRVLKSGSGIVILVVTENLIYLLDKNLKINVMLVELDEGCRFVKNETIVRVFGNNWSIVGMKFRVKKGRKSGPRKVLFFDLRKIREASNK